MIRSTREPLYTPNKMKRALSDEDLSLAKARSRFLSPSNADSAFVIAVTARSRGVVRAGLFFSRNSQLILYEAVVTEQGHVDASALLHRRGGVCR